MLHSRVAATRIFGIKCQMGETVKIMALFKYSLVNSRSKSWNLFILMQNMTSMEPNKTITANYILKSNFSREMWRSSAKLETSTSGSNWNKQTNQSFSDDLKKSKQDLNFLLSIFLTISFVFLIWFPLSCKSLSKTNGYSLSKKVCVLFIHSFLCQHKDTDIKQAM